MNRRQFLEKIIIGAAASSTAGSIPNNSAAQNQAADNGKKLDIGALVKSIQKDLLLDTPSRFQWYASGTDYGSDKAVILVPNIHPLNNSGFYDEALNVVFRHMRSIGLEDAVYGAPDFVESMLPTIKRRLIKAGAELPDNFDRGYLLEESSGLKIIYDSGIKVFVFV